MMVSRQGNCTVPPSWLQLSAVMVNVYEQLGLGTDIHDPITDNIIHSMVAMFVDDLISTLGRISLQTQSS
jgi:hypothetical protein